MKDQETLEESGTHDSTENEDMTQDTPQTAEETAEVKTEAATDATEMSVEALQALVNSLKQEVQTNLDGWQRSRAEFTNYKRRTTQELADSRERGAMDILAKFLPVVDDFERAAGSIPEDLKDHPWVNGTALILKNIRKILDEYNVTEIDPVGEEFDPNFHEAIGTDDSSEYESGIVTVTLQKGFKSGDRLLRPALVRVAS